MPISSVAATLVAASDCGSVLVELRGNGLIVNA